MATALAIVSATSRAQPATEKGEKRTVALLPVVAMGVPADEAESFEQALQRAVDAHYGRRVFTRTIVRERLEKGGARGVHCNRIDASCSAQVAALTGADLAIVASIAADADRRRLDLHLVDVAQAGEIAHASATVAAD